MPSALFWEVIAAFIQAVPNMLPRPCSAMARGRGFGWHVEELVAVIRGTPVVLIRFPRFRAGISDKTGSTGTLYNRLPILAP